MVGRMIVLELAIGGDFGVKEIDGGFDFSIKKGLMLDNLGDVV